MKSSTILPLAFYLLVGGISALRAETSFVFSPVINENQQRPDGGGNFGLYSAGVIEGNVVAFFAGDSIWTADLTGHHLAKLADFNTPAPGGTGTFNGFRFAYSDAHNLLLKGGVIVFQGTSAQPDGSRNQGLYSIPAGGGAITRIVDYNVPVPGGTGNFSTVYSDFTLSAGRVIFEGGGPGLSGIFTANVDGTGLVSIANGNNAIPPVTGYLSPALDGNVAAFFGGNGFDFSQGLNGLYDTPATGGAVTELYFSGYRTDDQTPLPNNPNPAGQHAALGSLQVDGTAVIVFIGDVNNDGAYGIYSVPVGGGPLTKIVDRYDVLAGGAKLDSNPSYYATGGQVVFRAYGGPSGTGALFLASGGTFTRLFGQGDPVNGYTPDYVDGTGLDRYSGGRLTVTTGQRFNQSITVASPPSLTANLSVAATGSAGQASVGAPFTYTIAVTNTGAQPATEVVVTDTLPGGAAFASATGGGTVDAKGMVTFPVGTLAAGQSASLGLTVRFASTGTAASTVAVDTSTPNANLANAAVPVSTTVAALPTVNLVTPAITTTDERGGAKIKFKLTRTGDTSGPLTVKLKFKDTADNGRTYKVVPMTQTIPAGSAKTSFTITPVNAKVRGGVKKVKIVLAAGAGYTVGSSASATVKIIDNE